MAKIIETFAIDLPFGHYRFTRYGESPQNEWTDARIEVSKLGVRVIDSIRGITREEYIFIGGWDVFQRGDGFSVIHWDSQVEKRCTDPMSNVVNSFRGKEY